MKKAVLFDVDGTLIDARDFVFDAFRHSLSTHGYPHPSDKEIKKIIGKTLIEVYKAILPKVDPQMLAQTHQDFQEERFHSAKLFPKVREILDKLKSQGFLLAAVSNRSRDSLYRSLKINEIFNDLDIIISVDDVENPKPHKDHLFVALKKLKVESADAYMVGDMEQDILAGKNAGVKTVGVTYGFLGKDIAKYNPDYLIDDIEELLEILN